MSNTLLRIGNITVTPAIPAVPYTPAYSYTYATTVTVINRTAGGYWINRVASPNDLGVSGGSAGQQRTGMVFVPTGGIVDNETTKTVYTTVNVPAVPAVAGVPGTRIAVPPPGWTSFARSIRAIFSTGRGEFNVATGVSGAVVGFAPLAYPQAGYSHILHGLLFTNGKVYNAVTNADYGAYTVADLFNVTVTLDSVLLKKNGATLATEASRYKLGPLYLSSVLNSVGDDVDNPKLFLDGTGNTAMSFGRLDVLTGNTAASRLVASFKRMVTGGLEGDPLGSNEGQYSVLSFKPLVSLSSELSDYGQAAGTFRLTMTSYGGAVEAGANNAADMSFGRVYGVSVVLTGGSGGSGGSDIVDGNGNQAMAFKRLTSLSSQASYGQAQLAFGRMRSQAYNESNLVAYLLEALGTRTSIAFSGSEVLAAIMEYCEIADDITNDVIVEAILQAVARGAISLTTAQMLEAVMFAFARANATVGNAAAGVGGGGGGGETTPGTGTGTPGTPGTPTTPAIPGTPGTPGVPGTPEVPGTPGVPEQPGTPSIPGVPGAGGVVVGSADQTWVWNEKTGGSTAYRNYGFNSYAKIDGRYYGASSYGLFELAGDTDNGAPVRGSMSLGTLNFGTSAKKTIEALYLGMSAQGNLFVKLIAEGKPYVYKTRGFSPELQQQRVVPGKGMRTNFVTVEIYNENGTDFELESVEFVVADLTRKI